MQQESSHTIDGITKDAHENVAIRADHRGGSAIVGNTGVGGGGERSINENCAVEGGSIGVVVGQRSVKTMLNRLARRVGIRILHIIKRAACAWVIEPRTRRVGSDNRLVGRRPIRWRN